jgi:hypothetical protein
MEAPQYAPPELPFLPGIRQSATNHDMQRQAMYSDALVGLSNS